MAAHECTCGGSHKPCSAEPAPVGWRGQVVSLLADLVDYPDRSSRSEATCRKRLVGVAPEAAALLDGFVETLASLPPGRIEELGAFELDTLSAVDATCYPYIGHHLLGESYRRSRFMVGLIERYREHGFTADRGELPDHLLVMLRFLAVCPDEELAAELVGEAILPALGRMTLDGEAAAFGGATGRLIYLRVLEAIRLALAALWPEVEACRYENAIEPVGIA